MKLKNVMIASAVVTSVGLTGCGKDKTITVWNPFTGGDGVYFQEMIDSYNATNPEYEVKAVITPDMYTKVYTVMNSNDTKNIPDLLVGHVERIPLFVQQDLINPMEDVLSSQPNLNGDNYLEQAWDGGEIDGVRYSVPLDIHSILLFYNVDLVNKYAPGALDDDIITWDEVLAIVPKAKADGIVTFPVRTSNWLIDSMVAQQGGSIYDGDTPTLNTPEALKALETLVAIDAAGGSEVEGDDAVLLFQAGESVFLEEGIWAQSSFTNIEGVNWSVANTPVFDENNLAAWSSSHQFMELKKDRTPEEQAAIGEFLEYVRLNCEPWAVAGQNVASKTIYEQPDYADKYPQGFLLKDTREQESLKLFSFLNYGLVDQSYDTYITDAIRGRISPQEALENAQKKADDLMKEGY